ncbi:RNA polymerase sigma factor [Bacteroidales bacterium]|nr:RNA polymerase sigma factor [Bacteroidales bacterium]
MTNNTQFIKHYEPIHEPFCRFCRAITGNSDDAEDLIQDTILNVIEGFDKIKDTDSFKSYLFSTASNLNKMKLRRQKFKAEFTDDEIANIIDFKQNPESYTDFKLVHEKILSMPKRTAEALILFHISDLSLEDIQKIQGGSLSGVKLRLKRGREKLRSMLETKQHLQMAMLLFTL